MRLASDNSWTRRRLKPLSCRSRWIILCKLERRIAVSCEISRADWCLFWLVLLTEHKVLHCYALSAVCRCLVAGQLYPSCGFSSADCRCFQVSDPCRAFHSTAFLHHTALTGRFLIRIASFCETFIIIIIIIVVYYELSKRNWTIRGKNSDKIKTSTCL